MRIVIRYCLPCTHQTTYVIEVDPDLTISELKLKIEERCKITQKNFMLKIEREDFFVKNILVPPEKTNFFNFRLE